jgi:hypothetical protein
MEPRDSECKQLVVPDSILADNKKLTEFDWQPERANRFPLKNSVWQEWI